MLLCDRQQFVSAVRARHSRWGQQFNWVRLLEFGAFRLEILRLRNRVLMIAVTWSQSARWSLGGKTRTCEIWQSCKIEKWSNSEAMSHYIVLSIVKHLNKHFTVHVSSAFLKSRFNCSRNSLRGEQIDVSLCFHKTMFNTFHVCLESER